MKVLAAQKGAFCHFPIPEDNIKFVSRACDWDECIPCRVFIELKMLRASGDMWKARDPDVEQWEDQRTYFQQTLLRTADVSEAGSAQLPES